jgi:hypothetical protein
MLILEGIKCSRYDMNKLKQSFLGVVVNTVGLENCTLLRPTNEPDWLVLVSQGDTGTTCNKSIR